MAQDEVQQPLRKLTSDHSKSTKHQTQSKQAVGRQGRQNYSRAEISNRAYQSGMLCTNGYALLLTADKGSKQRVDNCHS